jgi:hypothetical protein
MTNDQIVIPVGIALESYPLRVIAWQKVSSKNDDHRIRRKMTESRGAVCEQMSRVKEGW